MEEAVRAEAPGPPSEGPSPLVRLDRRLPPPTLRVTLLLLALLVAGTVLYLGRAALGPFILGLFLVYLLDPPVTFLHRRLRLPRWLAVVVLYIGVAAVLLVAIRLAVPPLVDQIGQLVTKLPELLQSWISALERAIADLQILPADLRQQLVDGLRKLADQLASGTLPGGSAGGGMLDPARWLSLAGPVARVLTSIVAYFVIPIFVFYLLRDRPALAAAVRGALPEEWRPDIEAVTAIVDRVFARWLRGQLLIGLLVGVAIFIGLEILSVVVDPVFGRFSVLLAVFAGIMELVPIIGPLVAAIPAVLLGATVGLGGILAALVLYFPIQQIETHFIVPKVQGDATDLHPGFVVAGIIIGASIGGILGAILALPLMAAFRDVVRYLLRRLGPEPMGVEPALAEALRPADWRAAPEGAGRAASMTGPVE